MRRPLLIGGAAVVVLALLAFGGAYAYYFSGIRTAPKTILQASPTASPVAVSPSGLLGSWKVGAGSQAEYLVSEQFGGQTSPHQADARTSGVSGTLTVGGAAGSLSATGISVSADLTGLHSVDQVAGFDVSNRDRIVQGTLSTGQFPRATFTADSVAVPAALEAGQPATVSVPGKLTIHGVTRDVTADLTLTSTATGIEVKGKIDTDMTQYGITPPRVPFTVVVPAVEIQFVVEFVRA